MIPARIIFQVLAGRGACCMLLKFYTRKVIISKCLPDNPAEEVL